MLFYWSFDDDDDSNKQFLHPFFEFGHTFDEHKTWQSNTKKLIFIFI
jgi:hypothetical protein